MKPLIIHPDRRDTILTHAKTSRKIKVTATTPGGEAIGRYERQGITGLTYHGGEPVRMAAKDIDWEKKIYNPADGRTHTL